MNGTLISANARGYWRAAIAIILLAMVAGCSRGSHDNAASRDQSATEAGQNAPAASEQQATPQQTASDATAAEKAAPEATTPEKAEPAPSQPARHKAAPPKPAEPKTAVLPAGTHIVAELQSGISTADAKAGDKVTLRTVEPVAVDGRTVVPAGSTINGEVTFAKGGGRISGAPELTVRFSELVLPNGHASAIACEPFRVVGKSAGSESLKEIGGGAAAGAVVGALLGKGKGALKGAAAGAVVGTGVAVATKGEQIELSAGHQIGLDLTSPVTLTTGG